MYKKFSTAIMIFALLLCTLAPVNAQEANAAVAYPFVVPDKTKASTGEAVNFKITTSARVNKIQTVIDGVAGRSTSTFSTGDQVRNWSAKIFFMAGGLRKVQFKCTMASGSTVLIPAKPVIISVSFKYTATCTSKTITKGKTVTFTLKTPSTINALEAVIDGVKQNTPFKTPDSDANGIKVWKVNITFFKLGERTVKFDAMTGTSVKKTFPDKALPIIVKETI
jgi:hypothetical protein